MRGGADVWLWLTVLTPYRTLGLFFFYDYDTIQGTYTHVMTLLIDFG